MQRSLKPQSTGQHRGSPPIQAGVAQQRQQQFRKLPGTLPHEGASPSTGPSFEGKKSDGRIAERTRRDGATHVPLPSGSALDLFAPVAQSPERDASNVGDAGGSPAGSAICAALAQPAEASRSEREGWRCESSTRHHSAHVVQRRDGALKTRPVPVQVRPWAPAACSPTSQRRPAQDGKVAGATPATRTSFQECQPDQRAGPVC